MSVSGKIYVGIELVGVVEERDMAHLEGTAQKLANAWPDEQTVLVAEKGKKIIKPVPGIVKVKFEPDAPKTRKPSVAVEPTRKPSVVVPMRRPS